MERPIQDSCNYAAFNQLVIELELLYSDHFSSKDILMRVIALDLPPESTLVEKVYPVYNSTFCYTYIDFFVCHSSELYVGF